MKASPVFTSTPYAVLDIELDKAGWLWGGTSRGELLAEHTETGAERHFDVGGGNPINSIVLDVQQRLWVPYPQRMLSADQLGGTTVQLGHGQGTKIIVCQARNFQMAYIAQTESPI